MNLKLKVMNSYPQKCAIGAVKLIDLFQAESLTVTAITRV